MAEGKRLGLRLPSLKVEEGAVSQGVRAASGSWRRPGKLFSPRASGNEHNPADTWI